MTQLRQCMTADMKLHGLAPGSQKVYLNAVRCLAGHYRRRSYCQMLCCENF